jgi:prepilin-type N-terminal cleavage/methylation domain-containing protein
MKGQRGYSLVEVIAAVAITGCIVAALALGVRQIVSVPEQGNAQTEALHAVQNAAHWVSRDGQTAKSAVGGGSLNLTLPDDTSIVYDLTDGNLSRTSGGNTQTLARNISGIDFTVDGKMITMNISAAPENRWDISTNQTYQVLMRPTG